jgi:hypothetical protein
MILACPAVVPPPGQNDFEQDGIAIWAGGEIVSQGRRTREDRHFLRELYPEMKKKSFKLFGQSSCLSLIICLDGLRRPALPINPWFRPNRYTRR